MTVLGFLANALILSAGALGFWLLDREVRPQAHARQPEDERAGAPSRLADDTGMDVGSLDTSPEQDRSQAATSQPIILPRPASLRGYRTLPVGSA